MKRVRADVLPNTEAERVLLGLMILGGRDVVSDALGCAREEFPKKCGPPVRMRLHKMVWYQLKEMLARRQQIDVVTVYSAICGNAKAQRRAQEFENRVFPMPPWGYFVDLVEDVPEHMIADRHSAVDVVGMLADEYLEESVSRTE